jgi:hypothetical protein
LQASHSRFSRRKSTAGPQLGEYEFYFVRELTDESGRTTRTKLEDGATRIAITGSGQAVRVALPASLLATGALND